MDATPLSTSIILLYSEAGCTFGNEIFKKVFSKMSCHGFVISKWVAMGWKWKQKNFLELQQKFPVHAAFQRKNSKHMIPKKILCFGKWRIEYFQTNCNKNFRYMLHFSVKASWTDGTRNILHWNEKSKKWRDKFLWTGCIIISAYKMYLTKVDSLEACELGLIDCFSIIKVISDF